MKKIISLLIALCILFSCFNLNAKAADYGIAKTADGKGLYVRSGPGTNNYSTIGTGVGEGAVVKILDTINTNDGSTACASFKWYKIEYTQSSDKIGYVCSSLVEKKESVINNSKKGKVTSPIGLIVREGASTTFKEISDGIANNRTVTITDTVQSANGSDTCSSKTWYKIEYPESSTGYGYACSSFVTLIEDNIDPNYDFERELAKFPASYHADLRKLHSDHPTWKFYAIKTNMDFDAAVKAQSTGGKSLISTNNQGWRSTAEGAYDYRTDTWKSFDGASWRAANSGIVAHYLDSRNFLDEQRIFMFEDLVLHDYQKEAGVQSILNGTFMEKTFPYNGGHYKYATTFIEAGIYSGVSPYALATRVRQEVVKSGGGPSGSASGSGNGYDGYYNFFNVGAYAANGNDAVINGLIYAKNKGWNTPYKSILEGSVHMGNNYILRGQNTLYFQRFNVNPSSDYTMHTHQYMTNIQAPYSESSTTYKTYVNTGGIDEAIVFHIPVYEKMSDTKYAQPNTGNPNNWLSNLKINNTTVNGFDGDRTSYTYNTRASEINITTATVNANARVNGSGNIKLNNGANNINIVVTAQNGEVKTYNLLVNKLNNDPSNPQITVGEIIDSIGVKVNENYMGGIKLGTTYDGFKEVILKYNEQAIVILKDFKGNIKTTSFATGDTLTIESGDDKKTYEIIIYGDLTGNGNIDRFDLLELQLIILKKSSLANSFLKSADINKDGKIDTHDLLLMQFDILNIEKITQ